MTSELRHEGCKLFYHMGKTHNLINNVVKLRRHLSTTAMVAAIMAVQQVSFG